MRLDHWCRIWKPSETDTRPTDPETGQPIGDPPVDTTYEGECLYSESGFMVSREKGGDTDIEGEAVILLPRYAGIIDEEENRIDVKAEVNYDDMRITRVRYDRRYVHLLVTPMSGPTEA